MFPTPDTLHPLIYDMDRMCFLKNIIIKPNVVVGDYTYYDDENDVRNFKKNVLYHYEFLGDKLIIGKFCQIASNVKFLMNGMFHMLDAFTTYPFMIFSNEFGEKYPKDAKFPFKCVYHRKFVKISHFKPFLQSVLFLYQTPNQSGTERRFTNIR